MAIPNTGTVTHTMLRVEFVMNETNSPQSKYYRGGTYVPANIPGTGGSPTPGTCNGGGTVGVIEDAVTSTPGKLIGGVYFGNTAADRNVLPQLGCPGSTVGGNPNAPPRGSLNPFSKVINHFACSEDGSYSGSGQGPQGIPNRMDFTTLDCMSHGGSNNPPSRSILSNDRRYGFWGSCSFVSFSLDPGAPALFDGDPIGSPQPGTCYFNTEKTLNPPTAGGTNPPTAINTGVPTSGQIKLSNMYGSFDYP